MSYPVDCTFRRDFKRAFPGAEYPALTFLSSFEDDNGYCMSTRDCIKQDEGTLKEEKRRLEDRLAQIGFTLDWLERNKEELMKVSETERLYENPDKETDDEFGGTSLVYVNSSVCAKKGSERPPLPCPRPDPVTVNSWHNETNVPINRPTGYHQELKALFGKQPTPNTKTDKTQHFTVQRSLTEGNIQSTDSFSRNPSSASDGSSMKSKQNDTSLGRQFLFTVRMNTDSGFSADRNKLSFRKNETLDVVEEWSTSMQQFYRVRNSGGHLGIVQKQICQPSFSDQSVLWGRPWFHQNITRHQAESLLGSCSEGSFLIRDSTKEIGNFVLSLKTRSIVGHYVITSHSRGYKFCNKDYVSLEDLIDYFRESPLDKGARLISSPLKLNS